MHFGKNASHGPEVDCEGVATDQKQDLGCPVPVYSRRAESGWVALKTPKFCAHHRVTTYCVILLTSSSSMARAKPKSVIFKSQLAFRRTLFACDYGTHGGVPVDEQLFSCKVVASLGFCGEWCGGGERGRQHPLGRLQVSVNHPVRMGFMKRPTDLFGN